MKMLAPVVIIAASLVGCVVVAPDDSGHHDRQSQSESSQGRDLNDPGSWAYEGCKQELLNRVRADHPQAQEIQIEGHVTENKDTDRKSTLSGRAKYKRNGDRRHITFTCVVDRDQKKILQVKYDKE